MAEKQTYEELLTRVKELEESERTYRTIVENSPDLLYRTDLEGRIIYISPSVYNMSGFTAEEAIGMKMAEEIYLYPEERKEFLARLQENGIIRNFQARLKRKDGSVWWASTNAHFLTDNTGKIIGVEGITRDITELKSAEAALKESEEKYRHLFETAIVGIFRTRLEDGKIIAANQKLARIIGYDSIDKLMEEYVVSAFYTDPNQRSLLLEQLQSQGSVDDFEIEVKRPDGSIIQLSISATAYLEQGYMEGVLIDITDRKRAEEALRENEEKIARLRKMESLGLMASGIAHDLNNVLSGIVSYPELILMDLPADSKYRKPIETIQESGLRAAAVVQDLLTVARGVATSKEPLNINDIVTDYLNSPEHLKLKQFHPTVEVKTNLEKDLLNIAGSQVHIRKTVMNLVSNASEAIDGTGSIAITTRNCYLDRPLRGYDLINIGEYVVLSVSDDGSGILPDDLERIFEPFYTKKVMGRSGSGLGLAVIWNTVQDHKGYINVRSDENGTTFDLYLPITREKVLSRDLPVSLEDFKGDGETVLVIDDEENQRDITCKMLDKLGYKPEAVPSGEAAIEHLRNNVVSLVLLDMIMDPGINGRETYERILEIQPGQKALIISGLAETDDVRQAQKLGAGQYLKKPVTLKDLGLAIKMELGK